MGETGDVGERGTLDLGAEPRTLLGEGRQVGAEPAGDFGQLLRVLRHPVGMAGGVEQAGAQARRVVTAGQRASFVMQTVSDLEYPMSGRRSRSCPLIRVTFAMKSGDSSSTRPANQSSRSAVI